MIIGTFHSAEKGFAGRLYCMGLEGVPIAVVPDETGKTYSFLIAEVSLSSSIEIGRARLRRSGDGGYLEARFDAPILPAPIRATMKLKPSQEGLYALEWTRQTKG